MFGHFACTYICASHVCLVPIVLGIKLRSANEVLYLPADLPTLCSSRVTTTWCEVPDSPVEHLVK